MTALFSIHCFSIVENTQGLTDFLNSFCFLLKSWYVYIKLTMSNDKKGRRTSIFPDRTKCDKCRQSLHWGSYGVSPAYFSMVSGGNQKHFVTLIWLQICYLCLAGTTGGLWPPPTVESLPNTVYTVTFAVKVCYLSCLSRNVNFFQSFFIGICIQSEKEKCLGTMLGLAYNL